MSNVHPRAGGPYSLFCDACGCWVPNTANHEMKKAVDCGYWNLYRYNPAKEKPLEIDSGEPTGNYKDFLDSEVKEIDDLTSARFNI